MKFALIGHGKTGSAVVKLLGSQEKIELYNSNNKPTVDTLSKADVAIIFIPGNAVEEILPLVLESRIPTVWGSTGYSWPSDLNDRVKAQKTHWVIAPNFSLAMNIIRHCIQQINRDKNLLSNAIFRINETHHINKKDKPSGTALAWKNWLNSDCQIDSTREGDVKGMHELQIKTPYETITLKHEAHDRALFAQGAIWAARYILKERDKLSYGIYQFSELVDCVSED